METALGLEPPRAVGAPGRSLAAAASRTQRLAEGNRRPAGTAAGRFVRLRKTHRPPVRRGGIPLSAGRPRGRSGARTGNAAGGSGGTRAGRTRRPAVGCADGTAGSLRRGAGRYSSVAQPPSGAVSPGGRRDRPWLHSSKPGRGAGGLRRSDAVFRARRRLHSRRQRRGLPRLPRLFRHSQRQRTPPAHRGGAAYGRRERLAGRGGTILRLYRPVRPLRSAVYQFFAGQRGRGKLDALLPGGAGWADSPAGADGQRPGRLRDGIRPRRLYVYGGMHPPPHAGVGRHPSDF